MTSKLRARSARWPDTTLMWIIAMTWSLHQANAQTNITQLQSNICAITNCPFAPPVIKSLDSASVLSPGGQVVLQGARFNSADGAPGQIVLKIGTKFPMQVIHFGGPQVTAYRQPYVERQLTSLKWADSHVFGQIPSDISGVMDGPATLEVWRSDGSKSAPLTVHFTAARDLKVLPIDDIAVKSCAAMADGNLCNKWSDSSQLAIPPKVTGFSTFSIFSEHVMFIPNTTQTQVSGSDTYSFDLKNGWALDESYQFENGYWNNYACKNDFLNEEFKNSKPPSEPITSDVFIPWQAGCDLKYSIALHISGPVGVPWK
jgi:hypothetical protein